MSENNQDNSWHLDKRVNLGHLLVTVTIAVAAFNWANTMDKAIAQNSQDIVYLKEQRQEDAKRLEKNLDGINKKLDRLLEK